MRKFLRWAALCLLALTLLAGGTIVACRLAVLHAPLRVYYQPQLGKTPGDYELIVVPGSAVFSSEPGLRLEHRLRTALELYRLGACDTICISGAYNEKQEIHETLVMKIYLVKNGVPPHAILTDEWGVDTAETIRRAKEQVGAGRVIVCTQSMYAPRTGYLAQRFGLDADIADSDLCIYTDGMGMAWARETLAAVKAVFEGLFVPQGAHPLHLYPMKGGADDA